MKEKTLDELGKLLALQMGKSAELEIAEGVNVVDEVKLKWMALGFAAAMELEGYSTDDIMEVVTKSVEAGKTLQA